MPLLASRATRALALVLLAAGALTACSDEGGGASAVGPNEKAIDALAYIGDGLKEDYKKQVAAADSEDAKTAIVEEATRVSGVVGQTLTYFDVDPGTPRTLELAKDGTVAASEKELSGMMSYATHWRVGDRTIDLCEDEKCAYYSSWRISVDDEAASTLLYTFTLDTGDVTSDQETLRRFLAE